MITIGEGILQGLFVTFITILIPILYTVIEFVCCLFVLFVKRLLRHTVDFKVASRKLIKLIILRMVTIIAVCIILSFISIWNYHRIVDNPTHNKTMYFDKLDSIYVDRNNEPNKFGKLSASISLFTIPASFLGSLLYFGMENKLLRIKQKRNLGYIIIFSNGISLGFYGYFWANAMMGI